MKKRHVVSISPDVTVLLTAHLPWWKQKQTPHYVAELLARRVNVVYVEPRVAWSRATGSFYWKQHFAVVGNPLRRVDTNLWVYTPWALPLGRFDIVEQCNRRMIISGLRKVAGRFSSSQFILWVAETQNGPLLFEAFPRAPRIFHAIDVFTDKGGVKAAELMARASDLVLATTPIIARSFQASNPKTHVFRNGWEFPRMELDGRVVVDKIERIPRPRIGLVSYFSTNLDYSLLYRMVQCLSASLLCIGRPIGYLSEEDDRVFALLRRHPRAFFLGEKPADLLLPYIEACDVCVAPYKTGPRLYGSDPLKVYQYLAVGKPVVATPVEVLEGLEPLIHIGRTSDEFIAHVRTALASLDDENARQQRIEYAQSAHWECRWKALEQVLASQGRLAILARINRWQREGLARPKGLRTP